MAKSKPARRGIKGYDEGGAVPQGGSIGQGMAQSARTGLQMMQMANMLKGISGGGGGGGGGAIGGNDPMARGGKIKHTSGPRIGKDDGLIPAQRGEYVVRKAAVKKLGTKVLNQVNKGKLPSGRGR